MWHYKATVLSVYDGDTLTAEIDLGFYIKTEAVVRLLGINTPELRGGTAATKARGLAARDRLRELVLGRQLEVISVKGEDSFGRWLVVVQVPGEARSINQQLLDEGHAVPFMV